MMLKYCEKLESANIFQNPMENSGPRNTLKQTPCEVDILVVGAGPTGLGAATRLTQLGIKNWMLVEATSRAGGLACTDRTNEGFLFDMGGHVVFSHYDYFDQLLEAAIGKGPDAWNTLKRESFIWMKDRFIPYPFQNNIQCLDQDDQLTCLDGLIDVLEIPLGKPQTFDDWIIANMGEGIANLFMRPYNKKVWAHPTTSLQYGWLGERVSRVDLKKIIRNVICTQSDEGWGPNSVFKFPREGGTGNIWTSVAEKLIPKGKMFYNQTLVGIDIDKKIACFSGGVQVTYGSMISTIPLDLMCRLVTKNSSYTSSRIAGLRYSSTHVIGLGIRGSNPHDTKCWMYYPEANCPFYRCTVFSNYSESGNVPDKDTQLQTLRRAGGAALNKTAPGPYWSIMFECSSSDCKLSGKELVEKTIQGAIATRLIQPDDEIVSIYSRTLNRGYPVPTLARDDALEEALPFLKSKGIYSRGRFGAWKYEAGNQDHSVMQGVEAVDNILFGAPEETLENTDKINGRRNTDKQYISVRN